jgi:PAS domain-containing protein
MNTPLPNHRALFAHTLINFWGFLTRPFSRVDEPEKRKQVRSLATLLLLLIFFCLGGILFNLLIPTFEDVVIGELVKTCVSLAILYVVARAGYPKLAVILYVLPSAPQLYTLVNALGDPNFMLLFALEVSGVAMAAAFISIRAALGVWAYYVVWLALLPVTNPIFSWSTLLTPIALIGYLNTLVLALAVSARIVWQQKLREQMTQERYFTQIMDNMPDVIFRLEADGRATYISPSVEAMFGIKAATVLDFGYVETIHPEDRAEVDLYFNNVLQGETLVPKGARSRLL